MHGRVKVRTTEQEQEAKRKEREKKLKAFKAGMESIFGKRQQGELDEEMLGQTAILLSANPDIYTLWNIRKEAIQTLLTKMPEAELPAFIDNELRLTEQCLRTNPKSYGAWYHRGWVLKVHPSPDWKRELALCTRFLSLDERNFHCWDYRRLAAEESKVPSNEEFEFSTAKIEDNFSNYSAWHYRSKLLPLTHPDPDGVFPISPEKHRHELGMVQSAAFTDPSDTSAWFYQRWLLGCDCSKLRQTFAVPTVAWLDKQGCLVACSKLSPLPPKLTVDGNELPGDWVKASSSIWLLESRSDWPSVKDCSIIVSMNDASLTLLAAPDQEGCFWAQSPWIQQENSPKVTEELQEQLKSCQQLLALEPDSKWTILTLVLVMQAIDPKFHHEESMQRLDKLVDVDPLRASYYRDLKSKYVMEHHLPYLSKAAKLPVVKLSLASQALSALYHLPRLALLRELDLSHNQLTERSLPALAALQRCTRLVLDHNQLASLCGLPHLAQLCSLLLRHNHLTDSEGLVGQQLQAAKLQSLYEIRIEGNPCEKDKYLTEFICQISKIK